MLNRKIVVAALALALTACAHPLLRPEISVSSMSNDSLLRYYLELRNASGNSDRDLAVNQSNFYYGAGGGLAKAITSGMIQGQGNALRERTIEARMELERRGYTQSGGLLGMSGGPMQPTYVQGPTPVGPAAAAITPPPQLAPTAAPPGPIDPTPVRAVQIAQPGAKVAPVAVSGESKYMFTAEQFAKANGCTQPVATMVVKQSFNETFSIDCQSRETVMVRCEAGACRAMQ